MMLSACNHYCLEVTTVPNKLTAGYYKPSFTTRFDRQSSNWFLGNKPTPSYCLADYPCYTLSGNYSELGTHCIVLGDEMYQHKAECTALESIFFDEQLNTPSTKKKANKAYELLSRLFFVLLDNAFYFVIADNDTPKILPFSIDAYQLTQYGKEIHVYIDLEDDSEVYKTNIVVFQHGQDSRFLSRLDNPDLISASTILKTGTLTARTPKIDDGFEDVDQSEAILASNSITVALDNKQVGIDSIKQLVNQALDQLPDKGIPSNNNTPLDVNILPPIGSKEVVTEPEYPAALTCKGCSDYAGWLSAYTSWVTPEVFDDLDLYNTNEVLTAVAILTSSQCATNEMTSATLGTILRAFVKPEAIAELGKQDFLFPDAIQFYSLYEYNLQNVNSEHLDEILKCDFTDSAFKIIAEATGSSYTLPSVKNFLRRGSVYKSGQRNMPTVLPFALGYNELSAVRLAFARAGLLQGAKLPSYIKYKCLDILLQGNFAPGYLVDDDIKIPSEYAYRMYHTHKARVNEMNAIGDSEELLKKKSLADGVEYGKRADFTYQQLDNAFSISHYDGDYGIPGLKRLLDKYCSASLRAKLFDETFSNIPYKYSLLPGGQSKASDAFDWLLILNGLVSLVPSLKHTYRDIAIFKGTAHDDPEYTKALYGLLLLISMWQRVTLGSIQTNPDASCRFSFNDTLYIKDSCKPSSFSYAPVTSMTPAQMDALAFGWVTVENECYASGMTLKYSQGYLPMKLPRGEGAIQGNFKLDDNIAVNSPESRASLSMEAYTYTELPTQTPIKIRSSSVRLEGFLKHSDGAWYDISYTTTAQEAAKDTIDALSIYPDHITMPSFINRGTHIATYDEAIKNFCNCSDKSEALSALYNHDLEYFKKTYCSKNDPGYVDYYNLNITSVNDGELSRFLLGDFGKAMPYSSIVYSAPAGYWDKTSASTLIDTLLLFVYTNGLYVNDRFNAALTLGDNSKDTALVNQYTKAITLFTDAVGPMMSKAKDSTQMGIILQSIVGYMQTNLQSFTYEGIISLLESTPDLQKAVACYVDDLGKTYKGIADYTGKYSSLIHNLSDSIVTQSDDLESIKERYTDYPFAVNTSTQEDREGVAKLEASVYSTNGLRELMPRFDFLQRMQVAINQNKQDLATDDVLTAAMQGITAPDNDTQSDVTDTSQLDPLSAALDKQEASIANSFASEDSADEDLDDISALDNGFFSVASDEDDDLDDENTLDNGFASDASDEDDDLDDESALDDMPSLGTTSASNSESGLADSPSDEDDALDDDNTLDTSSANAPVDTAPQPSQGIINASALTSDTQAVIPPVTKPAFIFPSNSDTTQADTSPAPLIINAPQADTGTTQADTSPAPLIINAPQSDTPPAPAVIDTPKTAPVSSGTLIINSPESLKAKPADTDETLYSASIIAPIISEALRKNKALARCNIVIAPELEGMARTEYIEPTMAGLIGYCKKYNASCYNTQSNEIYVIKDNIKMLVCLLHRHATQVTTAIDKGRFNLTRFPLPKMSLNCLL